MTECEQHQEAMDEVLAFGGTAEEFSVECQEHLQECQSCQAFVEESLALNQVLEEPLAFPPVDLTERVMARIAAEEVEEVKLPWAERFAWLACGAIAMYCLERLPEYTSDWTTSLETFWSQTEWMIQMPVTASASTLVLAAVILAIVQGGLIYGTRSAS